MEIVTIHCTASLKPNFVISKLLEVSVFEIINNIWNNNRNFKQLKHCLTVNGLKGKLLKPSKGFVVIYFKNLELLKPDKWGTNMLIEFISQVRKLIVYYSRYI